jgi:hypothetical protein
MVGKIGAALGGTRTLFDVCVKNPPVGVAFLLFTGREGAGVDQEISIQPSEITLYE